MSGAEIDLGRLMTCDYAPITEATLASRSQENIQLLVNDLFSLKPKFEDGSVYVTLPLAKFPLPREKRIPENAPETRWEKFAKAKGIVKTKKSKYVFDEDSKEFKPRHGYKSKTNESLNDWCIEVKNGSDPYEDQYEKRRSEKKERVERNLSRQQRNQAEAAGKREKMAGKSGFNQKSALLSTIDQAAKASASAGKFMNKLPLEDKIKKVKRKRGE
jgi:regulator of ribosome biosynthesis